MVVEGVVLVVVVKKADGEKMVAMGLGCGSVFYVGRSVCGLCLFVNHIVCDV